MRVYDGRREGWVSKVDFVTTADGLTYWDKAVKANPMDTYALIMRGLGWQIKGEFDNAIIDYTEAIRLKPSDFSAYMNRGTSYQDRRDYDKAIADYTEAIRLDPKAAVAYANRGSSYNTKH